MKNFSKRKSPTDFDLVAEIGPNHNGSFEEALKLIDAAAGSGCTAVKFQYRMADYELFDRTTSSYYYDEPRYKFIKRVQEFSSLEHEKLRKYVSDNNMDYIASVMCAEAVECVSALEPYAIKIPSGEFDNFLLHKACADSGYPIILSTGMTVTDEIDEAIKYFDKNILTILHCVSEYPTALEDMNLKCIPQLYDRYECAVGLSDHSRNLDEVALVPALGGSMIELHLTLDRSQVGPDHHISWLPSEVKSLADKISLYQASLGDGIKRLGRHSDQMRTTFGNSVCSRIKLKKGDILTEDMICLMKPRTGVPPNQITAILGKELKVNVAERQPLEFSFFE